MPGLEVLLIISHVEHYQYKSKLYAYGPYAREIEVWADLFPKVIIASPCKNELPPGDCVPFAHENISIAPQLRCGGERLIDKIFMFLCLPIILFSISRQIYQADAVHARCPGNLGALGVLIAPLFTRYRIAKYAGQWNDYPEESFFTRMQKKLLRSNWWKAPVTVYGNWPNQPDHIIPFFTSVMTDEQMIHASTIAIHKEIHDPIRILFIGRLSKSKNVDVLIKAVSQLIEIDEKCICKIVGTGPEYENLNQLTHEQGLAKVIEFSGGVPFENVINFYEWADILVLASETEGWPKAITEAMAYGLVCIGSNRGLIPQILDEQRGFLVEPGNVDQLFQWLLKIKNDRQLFRLISSYASKWSQKYTLNYLKVQLRQLMINQWDLDEDALQ